MAVQKKKASKSRSRRNHAANLKIRLPMLTLSRDSDSFSRLHHIEMKSGFYRGKKILNPEEL